MQSSFIIIIMKDIGRSPAEIDDLFANARAIQEVVPHSADVEHLKTTAEQLWANDAPFSDTLSAAIEQVPPPSEGKNAFGLVVGNGYISSILPELPVESILMLDKNDDVHSWERYCGSLLLGSRTPLGFRAGLRRNASRYCEDFKQEWVNSFHHGKLPWKYPIPGLLQKEAESMGDYSFLSSWRRYSECRRAYSETPLVYANTSIQDVAQMVSIGEALREASAEITFLNLTNVVDYVFEDWPEYRESLTSLPLHENAFVAHSALSHHLPDGTFEYRKPPQALWSNGIQNYFEACMDVPRPHPFFEGVTIRDEMQRREANS